MINPIPMHIRDIKSIAWRHIFYASILGLVYVINAYINNYEFITKASVDNLVYKFSHIGRGLAKFIECLCGSEWYENIPIFIDIPDFTEIVGLMLLIAVEYMNKNIKVWFSIFKEIKDFGECKEYKSNKGIEFGIYKLNADIHHNKIKVLLSHKKLNAFLEQYASTEQEIADDNLRSFKVELTRLLNVTFGRHDPNTNRIYGFHVINKILKNNNICYLIASEFPQKGPWKVIKV